MRREVPKHAPSGRDYQAAYSLNDNMAPGAAYAAAVNGPRHGDNRVGEAPREQPQSYDPYGGRGAPPGPQPANAFEAAAMAQRGSVSAYQPAAPAPAPVYRGSAGGNYPYGAPPAELSPFDGGVRTQTTRRCLWSLRSILRDCLCFQDAFGSGPAACAAEPMPGLDWQQQQQMQQGPPPGQQMQQGPPGQQMPMPAMGIGGPGAVSMGVPPGMHAQGNLGGGAASQYKTQSELEAARREEERSNAEKAQS